MNSNLVITIGRTFGSGGREIGKKLAAELGMKYYDKELLAEAAKESGLNEDYISLFDEQKPSFNFFSAMASGVQGDERQMEMKLQTLQHQVIERIAEKSPCVIIGRRADLLLKGRANTYSVFVSAPLEYCVKRVSVRDSLSEQESAEKIRRMNRKRKAFYNYTGEGNWGEAANYDLCIDSSKLGTDGAVQLIKAFLTLSETAKNEDK